MGKSLLILGVFVLLIIAFFILIRSIHAKAEIVPVLSTNPAPMIAVSGAPVAGEALDATKDKLDVSITDVMGIERIELYVDGRLMEAQNFDGQSQGLPVAYTPSLDILPAGTHEIMVRTTNTQGATAQTQIIPVNNPEIILPANETKETTEAFVIEPDIHSLPSPEVILVQLSSDQKQIIISWLLPAQPIARTRIYVRIPGTSGIVLVGEAKAEESRFDLPASAAGYWDIYIAFIDQEGNEGSLGHGWIVVPESGGIPGLVSEDNTISSITLTLRPHNSYTNLFAYIRFGGSANRFQRLPSGQTEFLSFEKDGSFRAVLPGFDWPIRQPVQIDAEIWGWYGNQLMKISQFSTTFQTIDLQRGHLEFQVPEIDFWAEIEYTPIKGAFSDYSAFQPVAVVLPAPSNLHSAVTSDQCQKTASALGKVRNELYLICQSLILIENHQFLLWEWPDQAQGETITEKEILGFELNLVLTDLQGQILGETITAIPFPEARGYFRGSQPVPCDIRKTWYLRAVGNQAVSEWVYAGSVEPESCDPPFPPYNGCGGQMDFLPDWNPFGDFVPDLMFAPACNTHDQCYFQKWSGKSKVTCDNEFLKDLLVICSDNPLMIDPVTCSSLALNYYEAVNTFGRFFYEGDIDVRDCLYAVEPLMCFSSTTPEAVMNAYHGVKSGVIWTGEAINTGFEDTWDTTVQVGEGVGNVIESIWEEPLKPWDWRW